MHQIIHCERLNILMGSLVHRWVYSLIFSFLIFQPLYGQEIKSPFNGHLLHVDSFGNDFSFLVGGHFYGNASDKSRFPAASLLGNLGRINQSQAQMLISLGDMFKEMEKDLPTYERVFFSKLDMPLFNVVGNHDIASGQYESKFGAKWFAVKHPQVHMIFLDTELDDGSIEGEQLAFFKEQLAAAQKQAVPHLMIFSHRPIWEPVDSRIEYIFRNNDASLSGTNFLSEIHPDLVELKAKTGAEIYWFSGSMGGWPFSLFYHQEAKTGIHFLLTAIYNNPVDALIEVRLKNNQVELLPFSLTEENMLPLASYGIDYWENISGKEPGLNWKQQLYSVYRGSRHRYFWWGVIAALLFAAGIGGILRWRRTREPK